MVTDAAYARCLEIARRHYENFPVASRLLPRAMRPHVAAIYAFARAADDFADEGERSDETRLGLLDDWRERLHEAAHLRHGYGGQARLRHGYGGQAQLRHGYGGQAANSAEHRDAAAIFRALGVTMRRYNLEVDLLDDLLSAFRQDVLKKRYEDWDDVLDYCRRSANPVGRLVLRLAGYRDARLDDLSDAVCSALQLTNFWQDLQIDWRKGRLYVPLSLVRGAAAEEGDLDAGRVTPEWRTALTAAAATTRTLFEKGRPIADAVTGRLRWELRATWLGGVRILDRLEAAGFDVFTSRPALGWPDALLIGLRTIGWKRLRPASTEQ